MCAALSPLARDSIITSCLSAIGKDCSPECLESDKARHSQECTLAREAGMIRCSRCGISANGLKKPLKKCGQCKTVYYCSRECQRQDWPCVIVTKRVVFLLSFDDTQLSHRQKYFIQNSRLAGNTRRYASTRRRTGPGAYARLRKKGTYAGTRDAGFILAPEGSHGCWCVRSYDDCCLLFREHQHLLSTFRDMGMMVTFNR